MCTLITYGSWYFENWIFPSIKMAPDFRHFTLNACMSQTSSLLQSVCFLHSTFEEHFSLQTSVKRYLRFDPHAVCCEVYISRSPVYYFISKPCSCCYLSWCHHKVNKFKYIYLHDAVRILSWCRSQRDKKSELPPKSDREFFTTSKKDDSEPTFSFMLFHRLLLKSDSVLGWNVFIFLYKVIQVHKYTSLLCKA